MYEKKDVLRQLRFHHKNLNVQIQGAAIKDGEVVFDDDEDEDDFFNIDKEVVVNTEKTLEMMEVVDEISYMERLLQDLEAVVTDREYDVCCLRSAGFSLEQVASIFGLSKQRITQITSKAVDKLVAAHKD